MNKQKGIALPICLILLGILTLLAISGMNTSTAELVMAGNEQHRTRALAAAETGIEAAIAAGGFDSSIPVTTVAAPLSDADSYTASIRPRGTTAAPPGYNDTLTAEHYEIESTGASLRNANATVVQGFYLLLPEGKLVRSYWRLKTTE